VSELGQGRAYREDVPSKHVARDGARRGGAASLAGALGRAVYEAAFQNSARGKQGRDDTEREENTNANIDRGMEWSIYLQAGG
jgi:hypothetical protein